MRITAKLTKGFSRLIFSIWGFFLVKNIIPIKSVTNAKRPAANSTGWIILEIEEHENKSQTNERFKK